jgi:4-amino-4-deoxy-L-arabinose transferase-like glycosyltransferase
MASQDARARKLVPAAMAAGLLLRLLFGFAYWTGQPLTHDEREYLALAESIRAGRGFTYVSGDTDAQQFGRAPGYPAFLATIGATTPAPASLARVKVAQAVAGAMVVWIVAALAYRAAGPAAGATAAWITAVYPPLVVIASYVLSETLYAMLALGAALALQSAAARATRQDGNNTGAAGLAAGATAGLAVLVRPSMLFFLPFALAWLVATRRRTLAIAFLAGTIAVVAPWTARNYRAYGRFVLVASEGGVTFWTGNHPLARGEGDLAANPEIKREEVAFRRDHPGLTPEELEPLYYGAAFDYIRAHPGPWMALLGRKLVLLFVPVGPSYALHSTRYRLASIGPYLVLLPFAVAGLRRVWRARERPSALLLLFASAVAVCVIFFPQERFRIPVIDPTMIVCAAALGRRSDS